MNNDANRIARQITAARYGNAKGFVQENGNLRIVARSCATARVAIDNAARVLGIKADEALDVFEVRITGTRNVLTYPMIHNPMRTDIDRRTGALL